jgi:arsenate reductase-like glutaredoxin family protein
MKVKDPSQQLLCNKGSLTLQIFHKPHCGFCRRKDFMINHDNVDQIIFRRCISSLKKTALNLTMNNTKYEILENDLIEKCKETSVTLYVSPFLFNGNNKLITILSSHLWEIRYNVSIEFHFE